MRTSLPTVSRSPLKRVASTAGTKQTITSAKRRTPMNTTRTSNGSTESSKIRRRARATSSSNSRLRLLRVSASRLSPSPLRPNPYPHPLALLRRRRPSHHLVQGDRDAGGGRGGGRKAKGSPLLQIRHGLQEADADLDQHSEPHRRADRQERRAAWSQVLLALAVPARPWPPPEPRERGWTDDQRGGLPRGARHLFQAVCAQEGVRQPAQRRGAALSCLLQAGVQPELVELVRRRRSERGRATGAARAARTSRAVDDVWVWVERSGGSRLSREH